MLRVSSDGYVPADEEARAQHAKLKHGSLIAGRIWRSRSLPQFRLYWALLDHVAEATSWGNSENLHEFLKVRLGYFNPIKSPYGKVIAVPWSTAFDAMPQDEFQRYMNLAIDVMCAEVVPGSNRDDLITEVNNKLGMSA